MAKVKAATVRISIEGSPSTGTGFFISAAGNLLTSWHVIEPAFIRDSMGNVAGLRKMYMQTANGQKTELSIPLNFYQKLYLSARSNDYCLLSPVKRPDKPVAFFKTGDFTKVPEGQEVYTCGYPLGMLQPFISRGILSTRYIDSSTYITSVDGLQKKIYRDAALLDLALNKGGSGGPVIIPGATAADDQVIGIANFVLGPFGQATEELSAITENPGAESGSPMRNTLSLFSLIISNTTNGISGCLSINHFLKDIQSLSK